MIVSMSRKRKLSPPKEVMNSDDYVCRWLKKHKIWLRNHEVKDTEVDEDCRTSTPIQDVRQLR